MQYEYDFEYMFPEMMEGAAEGALVGAAGVFMGLFLLIYFFALAFSVVSYVLSSVGMYRIAKRRGIHHAWLSWIPVGSNWLLGSISDHYQYVAKQKNTKRRKVLLTLSLILMGATLAFAVCTAAMVIATGSMTDDTGMFVAMTLMVVSYLVVMGLGIAVTVVSYIAYYDLFRSCKPGNAVLFLILSVVFNVTLPFFVFFISNSDEGMPPRRSRQPEQIPVEEPMDTPEEEPVQYEQIPVVEAEIVEDPE